jgi:hypothetical protein
VNPLNGFSPKKEIKTEDVSKFDLGNSLTSNQQAMPNPGMQVTKIKMKNKKLKNNNKK